MISKLVIVSILIGLSYSGITTDRKAKYNLTHIFGSTQLKK